jgi:hypothetical protein
MKSRRDSLPRATSFVAWSSLWFKSDIGNFSLVLRRYGVP